LDPDAKELAYRPYAKAALSSIPEAVAAAPSADDAMTHFIDDLLEAGLEANKGKANAGIVFLHGFNCSFIGGMSSAAQIASAYGAQHVFCFSGHLKESLGSTSILRTEIARMHQGAP